MAVSKRERAAWWSARLGATRLIESLPQKPVLAVINYHRIGDPQATRYDPGVFSATTEQFDEQIGYLKKRYRVVGLQEAIAAVESRKATRQPLVLITFDDGYLDNWQNAFPVLRSHGVPAVFFLVSRFVGTGHVMWWEEIAYVLRNTRKRRVQIHYPQSSLFDLDQEGERAALTRLLQIAAGPNNQDNERFLTGLEAACDSPRPKPEDERCFLNWEEAAIMLRGGMEFGSHTHSHEILSRLSPERQYEELVESRQILTERLGTPIDTLAYPVGLRHTFSDVTKEAARRAGYRAAFSYYRGLNDVRSIDAFDIGRFGIIGQSLPLFRLQMSMTTVTGNVWF